MNQEDLDKLTEDMNQFMEDNRLVKFPPSKSDELAELGVKRCSKCSTVKNIEEFGKRSNTRDGLRLQCKACNRANTASHYQANREQRLEQQREYREVHKERFNEYHRERYYDPEDNYRLNKQLNRGYYRAVAAGNTAVRITPEELLAHWESIGLDPWTCYLTGEKLDHLTRSIDHVRAISKGGDHTIDNLKPCTAEANDKKRTLSAEEAREKLVA